MGINTDDSILIANVLFHINFWEGETASKRHEQMQKTIQLMNFPSIYQGSTAADEPEAVIGANSV